jgi:branched-chain amino acid transport system substrate-binding protein
MVLAGCGLLTLAACTGGSAARTTTVPTTVATTAAPRPPRGNVDGTLEIGVLLPQSGDGAGISESMTKAINMARDEINAAGGVNGRPVTIVAKDEGTDPGTAAAALDDLLTKERVDAIIGPLSSKVALALIDRIVAEGVVTCSPGTTAIALSDYPDDGYFFRTMPSDALQALALATAITQTGVTSTAIIAPDDDYGTGIAQDLSQELNRQANSVTSVTTYDPTATDFSDVVSNALQGHPRSIALIGLPDPGGKIIAQLEQAGAEPPATPIFVTDGMRTSDLFEKVQPGHPESVNGILGTSPAVEPTSASWFTDAYHAYAPGEADLYASYAYDCTNLIALASQAAQTDDPHVFKDQMVPVSRVGVSCHDFADCAQALAEGQNIDLNGASGPIELLEDGDPGYGLFDVFQYGADGKDQRVRQISVNRT